MDFITSIFLLEDHRWLWIHFLVADGRIPIVLVIFVRGRQDLLLRCPVRLETSYRLQEEQSDIDAWGHWFALQC